MKTHHPDLKVNTKSILSRCLENHRDPSLSPGARLLFDHIIMRAGPKGVIWYHNDTLAGEIGEKSSRQMSRYLKELEDARRIIKRTKGPYRYLCPYPELEHRLIKQLGYDTSDYPTMSDVSTEDGQICHGGVDRSDMPQPIKERTESPKIQAVTPSQPDPKRTLKEKTEKKDMKRKEVPTSLSEFDKPSLPSLPVQMMLRTLKRATEDRIDINALWKQYNEQWLEGLGQNPSDFGAKRAFCDLVKGRYMKAIASNPSQGTPA